MKEEQSFEIGRPFDTIAHYTQQAGPVQQGLTDEILLVTPSQPTRQHCQYEYDSQRTGSARTFERNGYSVIRLCRYRILARVTSWRQLIAWASSLTDWQCSALRLSQASSSAFSL